MKPNPVKTTLDKRAPYTKKIVTRNDGTPFKYYTLTITDNKGEIVQVHTSSDYSYICRLSH